LSFCSVIAEISCGVYFLPSMSTLKLVPISRLIEMIVLSGFVTDWFFANCPTNRSPSLVNATTDGVVLEPSALVMTIASPPSITLTQELVVPKSIPMIFAIFVVLLF
jgi:hypothetical protein